MIDISDQILTVSLGLSKRCSDYDEDCQQVEDHLFCYLGLKNDLGQADGYCPFIHTNN
jgi:hypothetical protein